MKTNSEEIIILSNDRIILAGLLILVLGFFTWRSDLDVAKPLLVSSLRMVIQLFLIGLILVYVFSINHPLLVLLIGLISSIKLIIEIKIVPIIKLIYLKYSNLSLIHI